jgi:F0F1-type ATP synthase assembly protein I
MKAIAAIIILALIIYFIENAFSPSPEGWIIIGLVSLIVGLLVLFGTLFNF